MIQFSPLIVRCPWSVETRSGGRDPGSWRLGGRVEARFIFLHSVFLYFVVRSYLVVNVLVVVSVGFKGLVSFVVVVDLVVGLDLVGMKCGLVDPIVGSCPVDGAPMKLGGVGHG